MIHELSLRASVNVVETDTAGRGGKSKANQPAAEIYQEWCLKQRLGEDLNEQNYQLHVDAKTWWRKVGKKRNMCE